MDGNENLNRNGAWSVDEIRKEKVKDEQSSSMAFSICHLISDLGITHAHTETTNNNNVLPLIRQSLQVRALDTTTHHSDQRHLTHAFLLKSTYI